MKGLIFLLALLGCLTCMQVKAQKNLVNSKLDFVSEDTAFREPFIDMDEWRQQPVPHRYIHGGFRSNGTRFSFYLPEKKNYKGHFFQYVTPFPDSETVMQNATGAYDMIGFAVTNGAYFIETNGGGKQTSPPVNNRKPPSEPIARMPHAQNCQEPLYGNYWEAVARMDMFLVVRAVPTAR